MKGRLAYRLLIAFALVATLLCVWFSVASFFTGGMDMYAYNRALLDSATPDQRESVLQQAAFLAIRVGGPLLVTTLIWGTAFVVAAARARRTERATESQNKPSHHTA